MSNRTETFDQVVAWKQPDGKVAVTYVLKSAKKEGETIEQCVERIAQKVQSINPDWEMHKTTKGDIPSGDKRKLRFKNNGKLWIDPSVKNQKEKWDAKVQKVTTKLESLGLDEEEIDFLINKGKTIRGDS